MIRADFTWKKIVLILTALGMVLSAFITHEARYAKAADLKRIESQVARDMTDLKIELLESRRQAILRDLRQTTEPAVWRELQETLEATDRKIQREERRWQGFSPSRPRE